MYLLNVIDARKSTASKELLFNLLVFIKQLRKKKRKFITFHSLKTKFGTEA